VLVFRFKKGNEIAVDIAASVSNPPGMGGSTAPRYQQGEQNDKKRVLQRAETSGFFDLPWIPDRHQISRFGIDNYSRP